MLIVDVPEPFDHAMRPPKSYMPSSQSNCSCGSRGMTASNSFTKPQTDGSSLKAKLPEAAPMTLPPAVVRHAAVVTGSEQALYHGQHQSALRRLPRGSNSDPGLATGSAPTPGIIVCSG